jgi:co-chaperonin GroES (HSP10)
MVTINLNFNYRREKIMRIVGPYILIEPISKDVISKGGIILPITSWRFWCIGRVLQLGEKPYICFKYAQTVYDKETRMNEQKVEQKIYERPDVTIGDLVLFERASVVHECDLENKKCYLVHYYDVACKIENENNVMPK